MPISVGNIVDALLALGGEAHANDIADHVVKHGTPPFPNDPRASVRARLQENCSSYTAYLGKQDIFESEPGSGVWRLRSTQYPNNAGPSGHVADTAREFDFDTSYDEGSRVLKLHYQTERNPALIRQFKRSLSEPRCEACQINLSEVYGRLGEDYIEAHHRELISASAGEVATKLGDLAALCPNCHRIIHKNYPMSVEALRKHLLETAATWESAAEIRRERLSWRDAVRGAIKRLSAKHGAKAFTRQQLVDEELDAVVAELGSKGATPAQTLSRILQELRDNGEIDFAGEKGHCQIKHLK